MKNQTSTARLATGPQDPLLLDLIDDRQTRIRALNDAFRHSFTGSDLHLSPGIEALPMEIQAEILDQIRIYREFNRFSDPERLHNRGRFRWRGNSIVWEIHCFDRDLRDESPDPADPKVTRRYLLVMLARESYSDLPDIPKQGRL